MAQDAEADDGLEMVTLFSSSAFDAEMEAGNIHQLLEANGIASELIGDSVLPVFEFQVQVPRKDLEAARKLLEEAEATGPAAADEAEAATEE
jgi:hypothetical protein